MCALRLLHWSKERPVCVALRSNFQLPTFSAVTASGAADTLVALADAAAKRGWRLSTGPITVRTPGQTAEFKCELNHD